MMEKPTVEQLINQLVHYSTEFGKVQSLEFMHLASYYAQEIVRVKKELLERFEQKEVA